MQSLSQFFVVSSVLGNWEFFGSFSSRTVREIQIKKLHIYLESTRLDRMQKELPLSRVSKSGETWSSSFFTNHKSKEHYLKGKLNEIDFATMLQYILVDTKAIRNF